MLTTLRIKNLALVADLTLQFAPGFLAITGETGAGKSILIGALNLLLGQRADRTSIRSGAESCSVEAVFEIASIRAPIASFLEENGIEPCDDHQLLIRRSFTATGTNRQFVNGSPTTLAILNSLGQWLVDIHGAHDHQSLLQPARQLHILDAFGGQHKLRSDFEALVRRLESLEQEKAALITDEKTYAQQVDLFRHQVQEISSAKLIPAEELQLESDHARASNAAKILELCQNASNLLSESDNSVISGAGQVGRVLHELQRIDSSSSPISELHHQCVKSLQELQQEISHYSDRIEIDPERLQQLESRLNLLQSLKRKYGPSLSQVIAFETETRQNLQSLENRDAELARINDEARKLDAELLRVGKELSAQRRRLIPKLNKAVTAQLSGLGFAQSNFEVSISTQETKASRSTSGFDTIEFQFAPNRGEPARPLRAIASSGELARVMLAIKTVLAVEDEVPVLVFDEVDANVGGVTAHAVGEKLLKISEQHQVICITHLAPVASYAPSHYAVTKRVSQGRTISEIELLQEQSRVQELARMLGGQTEAARKHAQALLNRD